MTEASESLERIMVIAAHPDDPEFGCAGTILKWSQPSWRKLGTAYEFPRPQAGDGDRLLCPLE